LIDFERSLLLDTTGEDPNELAVVLVLLAGVMTLATTTLVCALTSDTTVIATSPESFEEVMFMPT
jgi:hypothetical protein